MSNLVDSAIDAMVNQRRRELTPSQLSMYRLQLKHIERLSRNAMLAELQADMNRAESAMKKGPSK